MKVQEIMSVDLETCRLDDSLSRAAQIMWEHDCGVVPIVDDDRHVIGMLTDRDVCMAAYTQGQPLSEIRVSSACSRSVRACKIDDSVETAEALMREAQVRRIPVLDDDGQLRGIVSLGDLAQRANGQSRKSDGLSYEGIASAIAAISQPAVPRHANGGDRTTQVRRAG